MVVWKLLYSFQNGWFAGSILLFGSAPSRQRTCQTLRKDKSSPQKYFGQGDMLVPRFLSWQTKGHEMWWDSDVPCCCFCLCVHIYIYDTYSLLILKIAGGFPYGLEVGSSPRLNFRRKNEVWTLPQKRSPLKTMVGICLGGPQGSGPPNWLGNRGAWKSQGKTQRRYPRKDPWAECGVGEVEALQEAVGFFGLKPTEASPLETNQVRPWN